MSYVICTQHQGKTPYSTNTRAHQACREIASRGRGGKLKANQCDQCGFWFLYNAKSRREVKAMWRDIEKGVA